jgi:hypothetical protein
MGPESAQKIFPRRVRTQASKDRFDEVEG